MQHQHFNVSCHNCTIKWVINNTCSYNKTQNNLFYCMFQTACTLEIYNVTKENLIMIAHPIKIGNTSKNSDLSLQGRVSWHSYNAKKN